MEYEEFPAPVEYVEELQAVAEQLGIPKEKPPSEAQTNMMTLYRIEPNYIGLLHKESLYELKINKL